MVFTTLLLLTVLFVSGLYIYFPNNKFRVWLHSQFQFQLVFTSSDEKVVVVERRRRSVVGVVEEKKRGNEGELKRVFATFDKNSDGFITKQELKESLKNIRVFMSDQEVEEMMTKADANGDGLIDFAEFCSLCEGQTSMMSTEEEGGGHVADQEEELKEAFDVFDKDKDGLISVEELGVVLCSLGLREGNRVEACKEMVKYVDQDGDGMVNFDEFKMMMMKGNGGGGGRLLAAY